MPVSTTTSKLRAKSLGSSSSELKSRTPEEINIEMMALRKELLQAKEEGNLLKCRMRKMEEEHTKKIKQLEKNLAAAKKESNESEKKRESSAESISMLRQKCHKLEQALKEQELAMKKAQNNSRPARPTELKGLVIAYNPKSSARKTATDAKDGGRNSAPGPSPAIANELSRLKDSMRKLQADNARLQQQLKERNEEIKQLKQQALRSKVSKPSLSGSSSAPSALGRRSLPASLQKTTPQTSESKNNVSSVAQTRQSHSAVHRAMRQNLSSTTTVTTSTTTRNTKAVEKVSISKRTSSVNKDSPKAPVSLQNGSKTNVSKTKNSSKPAKGNVTVAPVSPDTVAPAASVPAASATNGPLTETSSTSEAVVQNGMDPRVVELQQKVAAKKIQRTWRDHHSKVQQNQSEPTAENKLQVIEAASIQEMELEEDVELIQSVLRGHQERLEYVAMQEDGGDASETDLKQALSMVQAAHKHIWNEHVPQEE